MQEEPIQKKGQIAEDPRTSITKTKQLSDLKGAANELKHFSSLHYMLF
jgi:hypothetical protein